MRQLCRTDLNELLVQLLAQEIFIGLQVALDRLVG